MRPAPPGGSAIRAAHGQIIWWRPLRKPRSKPSQSAKRSVIERDGGACLRCGATHSLTVDHILPRSQGGTNAQRNLQTLCLPCNRDKAQHGVVDYRPRDAA